MFSRQKKKKSQQNKKKDSVESIYLKFLQQVKTPKLRSETIHDAPVEVIKSICNAAYNSAYNPSAKLSPSTRSILHANKRKIGVLIAKNKSLAAKRRLLQSGGALPFLPVLIGSAIATLGAHLFTRNSK